MERKIQVYIEGQRLELFNDEEIQVTSTQQNVSDISKTYTDFSQSFTIPASTHNNAILQHFYQSDVDATIDHNIRRNAVIEIDLTFFRSGKIQIDKAQLKKGIAESYTLSFYGEGRTLLDYFGEDLLSNLDYSDLNHTYNGTEVEDRITDSTNAYNVKYPLISSKRIWTYGGQVPTTIFPSWLNIPTISSNNINHTNGHIDYKELFPAVRVKNIFKEIGAKYGVTFNGNFLNDERFTKLFLWYKNKNEFVYTTPPVQILFSSIINSAYLNVDLVPNFDFTNNTLIVNYINGAISNGILFEIDSTTNPSADIYIDIFQNGNLYETLILASGTTLASASTLPNTAGLNDIFTFKVRSNLSTDIVFKITYSVNYIYAGLLVPDFATMKSTNLSILTYVDLADIAPVMKVSDFFSGILKMFNMTCYQKSENVFQVEPLDDWYSQGAIVDISKFTDIDSIDIDRMKLYKKITMKFQKSESFLNKQFSQLFMREYGDTTYQYSYDSDEFTLDVPFENLLHTKFTGTNLQVGYSLNNEFAPYIPKPILLYQYDNKAVDFRFNNGSATSNITNYTPFGQDLYSNLTNYTLNFAPDISTLIDVPIQQTIFGTYYFSYLYNLYNLKQRLISVKTILPISLLTGLKLNDRLVIRDKRYIINSMQSNLTTGEVNFQLILDFRPMINATQTPSVGVAGGVVSVPIPFINNTFSARISSANPDVTIAPDYIEESSIIEVIIKPGAAGTIYPIDIEYTLNTGVIQNETINIIQR